MQSRQRQAEADVRALVPAVYDELRAVADQYFRRQPPGFTLRPTDLVDEACLQLLRQGRLDWTSTAHFRAIAAHKIWQVVVDHLRQRRAQKRGGPAGARNRALEAEAAAPEGGVAASERGATVPGPAPRAARRVPLEQVTIEWRDRDVDLLDLADALADLAGQSRRLHDVVMLHWFGGLKHAEVAAQLGVSASTAEKEFRYALAWLSRRLEPEATHGA